MKLKKTTTEVAINDATEKAIPCDKEEGSNEDSDAGPG
jgi:hypothetical protein